MQELTSGELATPLFGLQPVKLGISHTPLQFILTGHRCMMICLILTDESVHRSLASRWKMPVELALDLVALALYDIVIYADDSTSMKYAENGSSIVDMKVVLERVTEVATLFDADGKKHSIAPVWCCMHTTLMCVHPTS